MLSRVLNLPLSIFKQYPKVPRRALTYCLIMILLSTQAFTQALSVPVSTTAQHPLVKAIPALESSNAEPRALPDSTSGKGRVSWRHSNWSVNKLALQSDGDSAPGPFDRIILTPRSLIFNVARRGTRFFGAIVADVNGDEFRSISIENGGDRLVLSGVVGGRDLGDYYFPPRRIGVVTIINGDSTRLYLPLRRNYLDPTLTIVEPEIDSITPAHASPGATITIRGANFSPTPEDNFVVFKARHLPDVTVRAVHSTSGSLTVIVPLIADRGQDDLYSGPVDIQVQRAPDSSSRERNFRIDVLPRTPMPPGELMSQLANLLEQSVLLNEERQRTNLLAHGFDPLLVEALLRIPHLALENLRSIIDDAVAGNPHVLVIDVNNDGQPDNLMLDTEAIEFGERMLISSGVDAQISSLGKMLRSISEKSNSSVQALPDEARILEDASFYQGLKEGFTSEFATTIVDIVGLVACVFPPAGAILAVFNGVQIGLLLQVGLRPIELESLTATPFSLGLQEGERKTVIIDGRFVPAIPAFDLRSALMLAVSELFTEALSTGSGPASCLADIIVGDAIDDLVSILIAELGDVLNIRLDFFGPETIRLSDFTVDITPSRTSEVSIEPNSVTGEFVFAGRSPVSIQRFQATASMFPLKSRSDSDRTSIEVAVTRDLPGQPHIFTTSPSRIPVGVLSPITISGSNFALPRSDGSGGARVEVFNAGNALVGTVRSEVIQFRNDAEMVVPIRLVDPGEFTLFVVNPDGTRSNPGHVTAKNKPHGSSLNAGRQEI